MPRLGFFRSSGGDGGDNKKKMQPDIIDVPRQQQQNASPSTFYNKIEPRDALTDSESHWFAAGDVNELHRINDHIMKHQHQKVRSFVSNHTQSESQLRHEADTALHQHYLSESTSQPYELESESMQNATNNNQHHATNTNKLLRRRGMQEQHTMACAVEDAVDEIWRCNTDDFRSASIAVQNLRLAILADWEDRQLNDRGNKGLAYSLISYDPSDTFLSLQGATLRFHSQFELMKAERDADQLSRKIGALQTGDESSIADSNTVMTNCQSLNGVEWELTEQAAWEVWEEAIRTLAALAHACVGPAWRRQLKLRRQFIRERLPNQQLLGDVTSSGSFDQMSCSSFSPDVANLPSSSGGKSSAYERSVDSSTAGWDQTMDVLELISLTTIPEVLPAAMIRFAASVLETCIPPLRSEDTRIYWDSPEQTGIALERNERLLSSLDQHLQDERRWLRRRKRLGDAQRDLALGLFCGGVEDDKNVVEFGRDGAAEASNGTSDTNRWSIPGVHAPVMYMIHSWLDVCRVSLIRKEIDERNIPFHFEQLNEQSTIETREGKHDESRDGPPPTEILLPMKVNRRRTACIYPKGNVTERRKFTYWGELVDASSFDWWYTLRVLRYCSDLVSSGWRPPPSEKIGEQIILNLILMAEQGIKYFSVENNGRELHKKQIQKERLVACSCASESLVTMRTLAAREAIPQSVLRPLAISLCRLIYFSETIVSSDSNFESVLVEEGDALLEKEILTQQSFVASNSEELLSVLLTKESTACATSEVLLEALTADFSVEITEINRAEVEECAVIATVAIRALSSAMWGDPPSTAGVPLLRFFWEPLIDLFGSVLSTFVHGINNEPSCKFLIAGHETSVIRLGEYVPSRFCSEGPFLEVVLEILLAIQRLFRNETASLCSTEWESVVRSLDVGVSPWLLIKVNESSSRTNEIRSEAITIFTQITSLLCSMSTATGFHPIVDDSAREYLHLFCLRKIAPLFHMEHSIAKSYPDMSGDDATIIAISAIKSWSVIRYLPFKEGNWTSRARLLLAEAFLIPNSQSLDDFRYLGGYLHNPLVRLEALKLLFNDESIVNDQTTSLKVSKSDASASSMKSRNIPPAISLFSLTVNLRELHVVLVNSIILPRLEEVLFATSNRVTTDCQPNQIVRKALPAEFCTIIRNEFLLRHFAVTLLGLLYRSRTGESEKRHHFIKLLQGVAKSSPWISNWVRNTGTDFSDEETIRTLGFEIKLKLAAIHQIESCLGASFTSLPHTHANVPDILNALCDTARFFVSEADAEPHLPVVGRLIMTLASILPLSRLSCARNGQGVLMTTQYVTRNIPKDIVSLISGNEDMHDNSPTVVDESLSIVSEETHFNSDHGDLAPFVYVKQHENSQWSDNEAVQLRKSEAVRSSNFSMKGKQGTLVDFEPVAAEIKHILCIVSNISSCHLDDGLNFFECDVSHSSLSKLSSILCTILYTILSRLLSHGMAFPGADDLPWLDIHFSSDAGDCEEVLISRSRAVSDIAGALGYLIISNIGDKDNNMQLSGRVCSVLVHLSKSNSRTIVQHASCGLILILSSLRHNSRGGSMTDDKYDVALSNCAISFVEYVTFVLRREVPNSSQVLIPLIDALREVIVCSGCLFELPVMMCCQAFLLLFQQAHEFFEVHVVAFQAAVAIINLMSPADANLMMCFASGPDETAKVPMKRRIQPLLIDLLRFRLVGARFCTTSTSRLGNKYHRPSNVHNRLAREALLIETFPVELDNFEREKVSAWKVGNAILTLRLGSKEYLGWLEIVVRSPCSRIRRLFPWRKDLIIERPWSTIPFWEQLHPQPCADGENNVAARNLRSDLESEKITKKIARATAVIASFDRLVDISPAHIISSRREVDCVSTYDTIKHNVPRSSLRQNPKSRYPTTSEGKMSVGKQAATRSSGLKRTVSDNSLVSLSPSQFEHIRDKFKTVFSWLQQATNRDDVDMDLIHELNMIGFSPTALGVPVTKIELTSLSVSVHEKLVMPFSVGPNFNRAISILDRITPFQTHRIGLLYGGPFSSAIGDSRNNDGDEFLTATQAPTDFWEFAKELGDLVPVRHCKYFSGGLDSSESSSDGLFAFVWFGCQGALSSELNDPIFVDSMIVFHTVTLMPNRITNRKRHVGNDIVHIVYGLSMNTLDVPTISGQFGFITIYVVPLVHVPMLKVSLHLKEGLDASICAVLDHLVGSWLISRRVGAHFIRNLAMVADLICQSMLEDSLGLVLNTEDRDRRIRDTERHLAERSS